MAIKQQHTLSKEDFEAALVTLRLSVSEVSRESGIPRHIVSHFRNYGDGLKPEQAAKLHDYLEDKGIEFTDEEETPSDPQQTVEQDERQESFRLPIILSDDGLTQRTALVCRHFFIDERFTDAQIKEAGEHIQESFGQAKKLMDTELVIRFASDSYNEDTEIKLRELWGHLARIGFVSLYLQGRILINPDRILANSLPEDGRAAPKTFRDLLADTYHEAVAGLIGNDQTEQAEGKKEEVAA